MIKDKIKALNNNSLFLELYCLILCIIAVICWKYSFLAGMITIISIAAISLLIFNDFKYMIPCVLYFMFSNNDGFEATVIPVSLVVCTGVFFLVLIIYLIRNKIHLSKVKSAFGIALLGISCALPYFWHNIIPNGKEGLYVMYLAWFLYFVLYVLFASSLNKDSFKMLVYAFEYMAILLALECVLKVYVLHKENTNENILNFWYYLGWGLCNEAGIMMCVGLPFIFINMLKNNKIANIIIGNIKLAVVCIGMLLTTSRGTFLFGYIEFALLYVFYMIKVPNKRNNFIGCTMVVAFFVIAIQFLFGISQVIDDIKKYIFSSSLDDNGRKELWIDAIKMWKKNPMHIIFGGGLVSEFYTVMSFHGMAEVFKVYHSTFFETLACFGIVGVLFLGVHLFEKYHQLLRFDRSTAGLILISYIMVGLYGMIDNTYSMYYYMVPLVIIMATFDNCEKCYFMEKC